MLFTKLYIKILYIFLVLSDVICFLIIGEISRITKFFLGRNLFCAIANVNYILTDSKFKTIAINCVLQIFTSLCEHASPGNVRLIDLI